MCRCSGTAGVLIFLSAEPVSSQLVTCRCSGIHLGTFGVNIRLHQPLSQRLVRRASRARRTGSALLWAGLGTKTSVIFGYIVAIITHDGVQEKDRQCLVKVCHNVDPTWIGWRTPDFTLQLYLTVELVELPSASKCSDKSCDKNDTFRQAWLERCHISTTVSLIETS